MRNLATITILLALVGACGDTREPEETVVLEEALHDINEGIVRGALCQCDGDEVCTPDGDGGYYCSG